MWEPTLSTRRKWLVLDRQSQMNIGIFAIIAVVVIWFLMKKQHLVLKSVPVGLANAGICWCLQNGPLSFLITSWCSAGVGGQQKVCIYSSVYVQNQLNECWLTEGCCPSFMMNSPIGIPFAAFCFWSTSNWGVGMKPAAILKKCSNSDSIYYLLSVCAHYIIEKMISMRSAKRRSKLMSIVTILSILVSYDCVCSQPPIHKYRRSITQNTLGLLVWKESWLWGAFSVLSLTLTFEPELGSLTPWLSLIVAEQDWSTLSPGSHA